MRKVMDASNDDDDEEKEDGDDGDDVGLEFAGFVDCRSSIFHSGLDTSISMV